jgi:di-heme oxidoreductase (putative peroxidase)
MIFAALPLVLLALAPTDRDVIGREIAVPRHLEDGEEFRIPLNRLIRFGSKLFTAKFTVQEGAGRPMSKGTGAPLSDASDPLLFPRNFNRLSGPEANSCAGCHNEPFVGGGGDRVTEVFVLAQRFDFATFDHSDMIPTKGAMDERENFVTQTGPVTANSDDIANERKTISMNGSGFIEMLARQMTADLEAIVSSTPPGTSSALMTKGVSFGTITHNANGTWDTSKCEGLPPQALASTGTTPPSMVIQPFAQSGNVVSIRQFTNNAMNHHHGIQSEERFGLGVDADGDGFVNELTTADVTAVSVFQATLPVPGQVLSRDPEVRKAEDNGEKLFTKIGCTNCHVPALPLTNKGWIYTEPNPYNPSGNLQPGAPGYPLKINLTSDDLPQPRLHSQNGVVMVPAFTDLKLHNICSGPDDPNIEPLNQNTKAGSTAFFGGNPRFITRKLWGFANEGPFMHHGKFTTIREAVLNHSGEALASRQTFQSLTQYDQGSIIEFLKTLRVLPPGTGQLMIVEGQSDDESD